jgi:hypothetical protein
VGIFGSVFLVDPLVRSFDLQCRSECIWRQPKIYVLRRRSRRRRKTKRKNTKRRTRNGINSIKRGGRGKWSGEWR